jgi:formyl-CoA transferase
MSGEAGPLTDLRVLEAGQLLAGPFCGQLLGDFGADVVKLEEPRSGDPMRQWGREKPHGLSLWWPILARNKKSVTCNLRDPRGQDLVRRLIPHTDIFIENFRVGTLERWGLGYDVLSELNPGLILVRVTGYGQSGPYADRAGFGSIGEAMGGLRYVTGEPDRPPSRTGVSIGDSLGGIFAAMGALLALRARQNTGRGQVVDSAIYEAVLAVMESLIPEWQIAGYQRERTGGILPNIAPSNAYPTGDGASLIIAANSDTVFARLCALMQEPTLATDPRYSTHSARGEHQAELDQRIAEWTCMKDSAALLEELTAAAVPAGTVYRAADMLADEHFAARQAIVTLDHPSFGDFPMQGVFPRLSRTPGRIRWLGPELGQHNPEIYQGLLGLDEGEFEGLRRDGVV